PFRDAAVVPPVAWPAGEQEGPLIIDNIRGQLHMIDLPCAGMGADAIEAGAHVPSRHAVCRDSKSRAPVDDGPAVNIWVKLGDGLLVFSQMIVAAFLDRHGF